MWSRLIIPAVAIALAQTPVGGAAFAQPVEHAVAPVARSDVRGDVRDAGLNRVKATVKSGNRLVVKVGWSSAIANRSGDRYRVRAVAMRGGVTTVIGRAESKRPIHGMTVIRLDRKDRRIMRQADVTVVGISEHHRRRSNGLFASSFATSVKVPAIRANSTKVSYRDCRALPMVAGANLRRCDFAGADLRHVNFRNTDLRGARLAATNLAGAKFHGARIDHADFTGAAGANLKGARVGASGPTYLYWVGGNGQIGRLVVNPDGSLSCPAGGCAPLPVTGVQSPRGIAVDSNYIYWTNSGTNSIGRAALDGTASNPTFITGNVNNPYGIAVDGSNVYWTNTSSNQIGFAPKAAAGSGSVLATTAGAPYGLATDGSNVYWGDVTNDNIGQVNIANPAVLNNAFVNGSIIVPPAEIDQPDGLSINGDSLWWTNFGTTSMGNASLANPVGAVEVTPDGGMGHAIGITNNSRYVYWADEGANAVGWSQLNGQGTPGTFGLPAGVAVYGVATTSDGFTGPTVASIAQPTGWNDQTNNVTITGTGFDAGSTANIGTSACASPAVSGTTTLTCTVPADLPVGPYPVTVTNSFGQVSNNNVIFTSVYQPPGFANTDPVAPSQGPISTANTVRINGTNFFVGAGLATTTTVIFSSHQIGQVPCTVDLGQSTSTSLFCTLAATNSVIGQANITLTNPNGGTATLNNGYTFTYPAPQFANTSAIVPSSGLATAQTSITINGSGFGNPDAVHPGQIDPPTVTIAGNACTNAAVNNEQTVITCLAPAGVVGQRAVVVTNPDGLSTFSEGGNNPTFTYLPPPPQPLTVSPANGPQTGGSQITITGNDFVNPSTVTVAGQACTGVQWATPQQLTCVTPPGAVGAAAVVVTSPNQQSGSLNGFTYDVSTPVISSVNPSDGSVEGGAQVTLSGSGFANDVQVAIGGSQCNSVTVAGDGNSLTCTTTAHIAGAVDVTVTNAGIVGTLPGGYVYGNPDFLYWISPDNSGHIGRVQLDGSHPIPDFIDASVFNQPQSIVVDQNYIYWTNTTGNSIGRADLDGSNPVSDFINGPAVSNPFGIAVDAGHIYWTNPQAGTIGWASLDGTSPAVMIDLTSNVPGGLSTPEPFGIAVDSQNVYWGDCANNVIGSAPLNGPANPDFTFINGANQTSNSIDGPEGLAVAGGNIYWSNTPINGGGFIGWLPLTQPDSPTPNGIASGQSPIGVSANNAFVYWANSGPGTIGTATLAGASAGVISSVTDSGLAGVALQPQIDAAPTYTAITSPSPAQGSTTGGTAVVVAGTGFVAGSQVQIGGVGCAITSLTATSISCTTGAHAVGAVNLVVINPDLQTVSASTAYTYVAPPADVIAVLPPTGPTTGGPSITLSGSGFQPGITVKVGPNDCPLVGVVSLDGTTLSCTLPAGTAGAATITVTNPGASDQVFNGLFTYSTGEQIFWANSVAPMTTNVPAQPCYNAQNGTIGVVSSATLSTPNQCLVTETDNNDSYLYQPTGVAVSGGYIYWADQGAGVIGRAQVDGSNPEAFISFSTIAPDALPTGVAINGSYIYWSDASGYIGRASLANPSDAQPTWLATSDGGSSSPQGLAISSSGCGTGLDQCIYWADVKNFAIGQADINGSYPNYSFVTTPSGQHITGVAVDADSSHVYWSSTPITTTENSGAIYRTSSSNPTTPNSPFVSGLIAPSGVTISDDYVYWTDAATGEASDGVIGRALISSPESPNTQYIVGANSPAGLAVVTQ